MKKYLTFLFPLLLILFFTGCSTTSQNKESEEATFIASVIETDDSTNLIEITDSKNSGISTGTQAYLSQSTVSTLGCPELSIGDSIQITFDGTTLETYPLQLGTIFSITKLDKSTAPSLAQ